MRYYGSTYRVPNPILGSGVFWQSKTLRLKPEKWKDGIKCPGLDNAKLGSERANIALLKN